ncbi:lipopolysaccharide biosynthesis protein [Marinobacter sp.]|uniref:lipopolysaccharide biosynthesis protein n=1 Tax=Marinobacter sp. TaxID=50741 RepID=UPI002B277CE5|nr:lipopolysaccharide biosynthesis protein [Marinobacter sp.]
MMIRLPRGPIALGTLRTSMVLGLRLLVQAGTLLLVARMLGPEEFGAFAGIAALAMLVGTLATFGTHLVLLAGISKDRTQRKQILSYALPTTLLCGVVLLSVFLLICELMLQTERVGWNVLLAIGVAEIFLIPMLGLVVAEFLAAENTARAQMLQILPLILRLMVALVVVGGELGEPLSIYAYGYCVVAAIALFAAINCMPRPWPHFAYWRWPTGQELYESASYAVLNVTAIGPSEFDKALAARLLPLPVAGLYAAAARVVGAVSLPVIALMLSALPRLFRDGGNGTYRSARLLWWIFWATVLYGTGLAFILWWGASSFVWLFGDVYHGVDEVIRWLCFAVPGMALRIAAGNVLMAVGKPWMRAGFEIAGVVVLAVAAFLYTSDHGAKGMSLALVCSEWVMALIGSWLVVSVHKKNGSQSFSMPVDVKKTSR